VQDEEQEKLATSSHKFVQDARQANTGDKPAGCPKKDKDKLHHTHTEGTAIHMPWL